MWVLMTDIEKIRGELVFTIFKIVKVEDTKM